MKIKEKKRNIISFRVTESERLYLKSYCLRKNTTPSKLMRKMLVLGGALPEK